MSGASPWFVLDEGGAIVQGAFPGVDAPMAVIGVSEKGAVDIELVARDDGGRPSAPRKMGATSRLVRAILRLERKPFPSHLPDATLDMLERAGAHARMPYAAVFGHARRLRPVLSRALRVLPRLGHETTALTRTTVAVTQPSGSPGANVIAAAARAHVNMRVMVGETVDGAIERIRSTIKDSRVV